ncbi:MAG: hypothetical protein K6B70_05460, partial [Clostridia bacterium]|nr:hypothetical protein [Clostridia bacterium]
MGNKELIDNLESNTNILLTLKEWLGEGSYGYKTINILVDGNVLLKESNTIVDENGKKEETERNENIAVLNENDLKCLRTIIEFINKNFSQCETPVIFDYGVEIIMNCDTSNICIKNQSNLYNQLINILN